jgi:ATP-dependent protease ClpP protease subunit
MRTPWTFIAKAAGELQIDLMEEIGADPWTGTGVTSKQFAQDLRDAGDLHSISLMVNSPGGSCFEGLSIYNQLLAHPARVTATVTGIAASIASVIIMAADTIYLAKNALMMIHNASTMGAGDAAEFRKLAEILDKVQGSMIQAYRRHSPLSAAKILALCAEETWMDSQEAIANGFATKILPDESATMGAGVDFSRFAAKFKNAPAAIAARLAGAKPDVPVDVPAEEKSRLRSRIELLRRLPDGC